MFRYYLVFGSICSFLLSNVCDGAGAESLKKIKESGHISIGFRPDFFPVSYIYQQQALGYNIDICKRIIAAIKARTAIDSLDVKWVPVTAANRIPTLANGTVDMDCGPNGINSSRRENVSFTIPTYVEGIKIVWRKDAKIHQIADLEGKKVVANSGTTSLRVANETNLQKKLGMLIADAQPVWSSSLTSINAVRMATQLLDEGAWMPKAARVKR